MRYTSALSSLKQWLLGKHKMTYAVKVSEDGVGYENPQMGALSSEACGTEEFTQGFKVAVCEDGETVDHHLVVTAYYPEEMPRDRCEELGDRLRAYFGDYVVSF